MSKEINVDPVKWTFSVISVGFIALGIVLFACICEAVSYYSPGHGFRDNFLLAIGVIAGLCSLATIGLGWRMLSITLEFEKRHGKL